MGSLALNSCLSFTLGVSLLFLLWNSEGTSLTWQSLSNYFWKGFAKLLKLQLQVCHIWIFDLQSTVVVCSVKSTEINVIYAACLCFCGEVVALLLLGIHIYVFCLSSVVKGSYNNSGILPLFHVGACFFLLHLIDIFLHSACDYNT